MELRGLRGSLEDRWLPALSYLPHNPQPFVYLWVLSFLALNLQLRNEGSQGRAPGPETPPWLSCKGQADLCGDELQLCSLLPLLAEKI